MELLEPVEFGQLQLLQLYYNADKQNLMCQHFYHVKIAIVFIIFWISTHHTGKNLV